MTDTETEDWPEPGTSQSVLRPGGPFAPIRRGITYLAVLLLLGVVLSGATGEFRWAFVAGYGIGVLGMAWLALWFLDTILAYLKH